MQASFSSRRLASYLLAFLFAAASTTYSVLWVLHVRRPPPQPTFTNYEYSIAARSMKVGFVFPGGPGEEAGLRAGDHLPDSGDGKSQQIVAGILDLQQKKNDRLEAA